MSSQGELVGFGDSFCFEDNLGSADGSFAVDCGRDEYCLTDMRVNWTPQGDQEATITRRCAKELKFYISMTHTVSVILNDPSIEGHNICLLTSFNETC